MPQLSHASSFNEILFDNAADGILIHDAFGIIVDVNKASLDNLGYQHAELENLTIFDIEIGATREQLLATWKACEPEHRVDVNGLQRRKDGSVFPVEVNISAFYQDGKKLLIAIARDITERLKTQQDLNLFKSMIESSADPIYLLDRETRKILYVNEAAIAHFGANEEEILDWDITQWLPDFNEANYEKHIHNIVEHPGTRIETRHRIKTGEIVPVEVSLNAIAYHERQCLFGFIQNITQRRRFEAQQKQLFEDLQAKSDRLSAQITALDQHAIVSIADRRGNITYVNPKFEQISQYTSEEVEGQPHRILKSGYHNDDFYKKMWHTISRGEVWHGQINNRAKDGSYYWVESTIVPLMDEHGEPEQYIALRTDITYLKELELKHEAALKALWEEKALVEEEKNRAEHANKAKSEFLSSMSHELRTPLNSILGFAQLLQIDAESPLTEQQKESLGIITESGQHLLSLINEVLDLAAIESGQLQVSLQAVSLIDAVNEVITSLDVQARHRKISLVVRSNENRMVLADTIRCKQILLNLISNAIKYNKEQGKVVISWQQTNDNHVRINIEDTGSGISEENQSKLFSAFSRLGYESSSVEGTGIGLVVTKNLVELMGGRIGFTSQLNKGSTFWFELPVASAEH